MKSLEDYYLKICVVLILYYNIDDLICIFFFIFDILVSMKK